MSEPKVDQPAAEREPDNVTPLDPWVAARDEAGKMTAAEADAYYTALEQQRTAPVEPERRTVSLEVLTDELRALGDDVHIPLTARVGAVLRIGGMPVLVADTDAPWTRAGMSPVKALRGLLTEIITGANRLEREEGFPFELLMPSADVLAALDGRPDAQLLTAPVWILALDVEAGMLLAPLGSDGLRRITGTPEPCVEPECSEGASCVVLRFDDGGEQHQSGYARTRVRIPCAVAL